MTTTDTLDAPDYEIYEPTILYVTYLPGGTELSVYRSVIVRDTDPMYQRALGVIGDAELVAAETVTDPGMMFAQAELSIYRVAT